MTVALQRFVDAQADTYERAMEELRGGCKRSHWMWFVFPQLRGLGRSPQAAFYGIDGPAEARAYLAHPVLGPRLEAATRAVLDSGQPPLRIFGELDCMKFVSCMTLFAQASSPGSAYHAALRAMGHEDARTLAMLAAGDARPGGRD